LSGWRIRRLAAHRRPADLHGRARLVVGRPAPRPAPRAAVGARAGAAVLDAARSDHAVSPDGGAPHPAAARPDGGARDMQALFSRYRLIALGGSLAVILLAPLLSSKGFWLSLLCQIGISTVFALSFNMLLGQTGLLSFGHAVYFGLGAFATIHLLRAINEHSWRFPVTLLPLAGGAAGLLFGLALGYVTT